MAETNEKLFQCVKTIISHAVDNDGDLIKNFAGCLATNDVISKSQKKKIYDDVDDGFLKNAAGNLSDCMLRHSYLWDINLAAALLDEKCPDIPGHSLLLHLLSDDDILDKLYFLIISWDHLINLKTECMQLMKLTWPSEETSVFCDDWPLKFISKCREDFDKEKVAEFVTNFKSLKHEKGVSEEDKSRKASSSKPTSKHTDRESSQNDGMPPKRQKYDEDDKTSSYSKENDTSRGDSHAGTKEKPVTETAEKLKDMGLSDSSKKAQPRKVVDVRNGTDKMEVDENQNVGKPKQESKDDKKEPGTSSYSSKEDVGKEKEVLKQKDEEELKSLSSNADAEEIEFRVVLGENNVIPATYDLWIYTNLYGEWTRIKMEWHSKRKFFYRNLPFLKKRTVVEYKYALRSFEKPIIWEQFTHVGTSTSNRLLYDINSRSICHDVVSFIKDYNSKSWYQLNQEAVIQHLPGAEFLTLRCESDEDRPCSFGREAFSWMHTIRKAWNITHSYVYYRRPSMEAIEQGILDWLWKNSLLLKKKNKHDTMRVVLSTLALTMALHHEEIMLYNENLLSEIFKLLSIHTLSEDDQKLLYKEIFAECQSYDEKSLPIVQDSIISLYRRLFDLQGPEFILSLPLYWLIADQGEIDKSAVKLKKDQGQLLHKRSGLPPANNLAWSTVRQRCSRETIQRDLVKLSKDIYEIYQVHPWIVGAFHYMLRERTIVELISTRDINMIGDKFALDSVFFHLLNACKPSRYTGELELSEVANLSDFFVCTFQNLLEQAKAPVDEISDSAQDSGVKRLRMGLPVNVLASFHAFFKDEAYSTLDYRQTESRNNDVLWCLSMTRYAAELMQTLKGKSSDKVELERYEKGCLYLDDILTSITTRIHKGRINEEQIGYWNGLVIIKWHNSEFQDKWMQTMKREMQHKIRKTWKDKDEDFLNFYAITLENFNLEEAVEVCFSEKAFQCTELLLSKYAPANKKGKDRGFTSMATSTIRNIYSRFSTPRFIQIFDKLFNRELNKAHSPRISFDMQVLQFMFTWAFASQFFRLFHGKETLSKFSHETKEKIMHVTESFKSIIDSLKSGDILVKQLKLILQNREKFLELNNAIQFHEESSVDKMDNYLTHLIDQQETQLKAFETAQDHVRGFISACSKLDEGGELRANVTELRQKLSKNFDEETLSSISSDSLNQTGNKQATSFFNLTTSVLKQFQIIDFIKDSKVFHEIWHQSAVEAKSYSTDSNFDLGDSGLWIVKWTQVLDEIWKPTRNDLSTLVQDMDSGSLSMETASEWFRRCDGEPDEIKNEIKTLYDYYELVSKKEEKPEEPPKTQEESPMHVEEEPKTSEEEKMSDDGDENKSESDSDSDNDSWKSESEKSSEVESEIDLSDVESEQDDSDAASESEEEVQYSDVGYMELRTRQMCNYFQLEKAKETIDVLLHLKTELKLNGDFSAIEKQKTSLENKTATLEELADEQEIPFVCQIPKSDVDVLRNFIKEKELITWLKEKMNDISEVKVMCDLAMISAGETPYEVDIVSCLLSAVMGFAPLIFELDEEAGLNVLLDKCRAVWKNRNGDAKLMDKWKDTGSQLAWFQGIENFHGSVEKQSLTFAQDINKRGIYTIRRLNAKESPSVKNCINLILPDKTDRDKKDVFQLEALCDLQSKLMLIAGEAEMGQTDVTQFVEVLTAVQTLAGTYVKLVSSGCMLFNNWSAVITCNDVTSNTNNLLIQVKFADDAQPLSGTGSLIDLSKLSNILNESLERWNHHINAKRMEHYFLNEFNIQQIIYLCHELALCRINRTLPDQVSTLLSSVATGLSIKKVCELLDEATKIRDDEVTSQQENQEENMETEENENVNPESEAKDKAVNLLLRDESISENVAKAAVEAVGYEDLKKCSDWVLLHEFDDKLIEELCEEYDKQKSSDAGASAPKIDVIEEKNRAVRKLVDEDQLEEIIAKAAVEAEGYEDTTNCLTWALFNTFEDEMIKELSDKFDQSAGFTHQEKQTRVITSVLYNRSENTLKDVIDRLQEQIHDDVGRSSNALIDSINTICTGYHDETRVITLQDSLSIEHFGRFLRYLHDGASQFLVHRELMQPLHKGRPNLIVCPEHEILPTTLSLYMYNKEQPLPTRSEVLLCSEDTTADDVERFMRRAMCHCENIGQLLFILAFADKLSFNVSASTEKIFNHLSQDVRTNQNYQLVILLTKQQHYLTTCFDKYLVEGKWISASADISLYLEHHLKVNDDNLMNSASCVDKKHSMVKVVSSTRSGVGKSLHVKRLSEALDEHLSPLLMTFHHVTIRLLEKNLSTDYVIERLNRRNKNESCNNDTMLIHLDLTPAVQQGIETFAFNLFVLGSIQDSHGKVWKRHYNHLYMLEMTDCGHQRGARYSPRHILNLLPSIKCFSPREVFEETQKNKNEEYLGMDEKEFHSDTFQRPYQYLMHYDDGKDLDAFVYQRSTGTPKELTGVLLKHCCMYNPSWAQLRHFASFLNVQLQNCENSIFCDKSIVGQELQGLKAFAVRFMIRMSQDFATPSLNISDESSADFDKSDKDVADGLQIYQFRRKWEESTHPYLFFNEDRTTMTFINVNISDEGDLLDRNGEIVEPAIISKQLVNGLKLQRVSLDLNFDTFTRELKLRVLCQVMGIEDLFDPDPTYELTTDNVLKILAIYMRFRCRIPVIIMGETGCGKTRMVEFMSRLKAGPFHNQIRNMITLKIHGGISVADIYSSVRKASHIADDNKANHKLSTILFYDEANTTEAIYAIKEVMCDLTIDGNSFQKLQLQLVAACNPYKQLSKEAIRKLEDSGLGYRIRTSETTHLFGDIPMRTLVYRVVALPPSMQPFVWDFGQLSDEAERIYIQQMTRKLAEKLEIDRETIRLVNAVFCEAQNYMRSRQDECRYVSLRDVERCVITYEWFHKHREVLYPLIETEIKKRYARMTRDPPDINSDLRTLLQTIGVCYHASLDDRIKFREAITYAFGLEGMLVSELTIREEISAAQAVFLRNMKMDDNIAANEALQENVFMMTVCADMRIPLFLIGKPGSSKSLAKTIVGDNMQGGTSRSPLYKKLKQVHILSYQCSALTDAAGIESVFKQCAQLQVQQDLESYTAVVVLDEIGLAEDSPNMPLKVLHPLLECGSTANNSLTEYDITKKVGFVGISNWALDPAKMNRGIFVTRNKPNKDDLKKTAKGIFENHKSKINENLDLLERLTHSYLTIYEAQEVEYFGLRDYYSLIKMIHAICTSSKDAKLTPDDVANAIHRNFSGGKKSHFETFRENIEYLFRGGLQSSVPIRKMISDNLQEKESRFLLLLTNQFSAANLLHMCMDDFEQRAQVVFGSSFPGDHNYTDICRNINRIKVCMETGRTVVLLNMTEIHESLYDALNQHYVTFGGQRYVDLGLGGHRVKCRIADNFRLIVVEQNKVVYSKYPIPLINRLEKHHLDSKSLLSPNQTEDANSLTVWADNFANIRGKEFLSKDAFVGFHDDTVCSVVLTTQSNDENVYKEILLQSAGMDAIFRLPESQIGGEIETIQKQYLQGQCHDSLLLLLKEVLKMEQRCPLFEITSYSNILSESDRQELETGLNLKNSVMLLSLEQFETEQEYASKLDDFFSYQKKATSDTKAGVLLIQCSQSQSQGQLIACAKYCLTNKIKELNTLNASNLNNKKIVVAFLLSTEREGANDVSGDSLLLQHVRDNQIVYVDELRPTNNDIAPASQFYKKSLCEVLRMGLEELESERQEGSLVNIISLLQDCVCEAVAKVKSRLSKSERYFDRVRILTELCSETTPISIHFRKILLQKMIDLYSQREEQILLMGGDWITNEACNRESLQEGGTFRKTLWLCLKRHVSRMMAYIISISDRHDNLNLLLKTGETAWKAEMWLKIFQALPLSWSSIGGAREFLITAPQHHKSTIACTVPFSYELHEFFTNQWDTLYQQQSPNMHEIFYSLFRESPLFEIAGNALRVAKVINMIKLYALDLLHNVYVPGSDNPKEFEAVRNVIHAFSMKKYQDLRKISGFTNGDEFAMVFLTYQEHQKYLKLLAEIFRACPEMVGKADDWVKKQQAFNDFRIHIFAFKSVMELLQEKAESLNDANSCLAWKNLMTTIKRIFKKTVDYIYDEEAKKEIQEKWTPLIVVDLLIGHVLPSSNVEEVFKRYLSVIAPQVKLLWRGIAKTDIRSYQVLRIVSNVLRRLHDDIRLKILLNWHKDFNCRLCRKRVENPTFLQCGHFTCEMCILRLMAAAQTGRRCPTCAGEISEEDSHPKPAVLNPEQIKELENFQSNCTSFFMEYLRQFCFAPLEGSQAKSMEMQIKTLIRELVVQAPGNERKEIVNPSLDLNINARSSILRILMDFDPEIVKNELNEWMAKSKRSQLRDITLVITKCFEDKLILDSIPYQPNRISYLDRWEKLLGAAWRKILLNDESLTKVSILQAVAEIRQSISISTSCIQDIFQRVDIDYEITAKSDNFVSFAVKIIIDDTSESVLKEFIIKIACRIYGSDWFHQLRDNAVLEDLIPISLLEASEDKNKTDRWPLLGKSYTKAKSMIYKSPATDVEKLVNSLLPPDAPLNRLGKILSLFTWSLNKPDDIKTTVSECLKNNPDAGTHFFSFLIHLQSNFIPMLKAIPHITEQQVHTLYQLVTLIVAMVTARSHMMDGFLHLLTRPSIIRNMFLPAMPENPYFSTPVEYRRQGYNTLYTCPNGHIYTIGECTQPMQTAKCADCGATIGGAAHRPAAGNQRHALLNEQSQAGYNLNQMQGNVGDPADRVSKQGAAVIQFILHSCMLIGLNHEEATIVGMLNIGSKSESQKYLVKQLLTNLQNMSNALARNMDDTILVLYKIILRVLNQREGPQPPDWSTLDKRREWETMFRQQYLLPVFQNLDDVITEAQNTINEAEDQCSVALHRLVHEVHDNPHLNATDFKWNDPMLWKTIEHSTSARLIQYLGDATDVEEGVLTTILHSPDLELVKYLRPVLQLQNALIQKYQNETDMNDTEQIKLKDFLREGGHSYQEHVEKYIEVWNKVHIKLKARLSHEKRLTEYFRRITRTSPISMGLPSTRGRGQCAKILAEYLIDLQNAFLTKCKQVMPGDESIEEAEVSQLLHTHYVQIDKQEDLLPLIHMHTKYNIIKNNQGRHHRFSYNINALEKQTRENFVMYKKLIAKQSLPCIQYPQDIGIGSDWDKVLSNTSQLPLSAKLAQDVDRIILRVTSADVCEGVRTLTQAISFLAKVKSNGKRYLYEFLEKDLLLSASRTSVIPRTVQIEHTLSLYNRLSWHKSVHFSKRGLNPYKDALSTVEQSQITNREVLAKLKEIFEHSDVILLQQRLNEMLIKIPDFNADWSLTDIFPYFDFIGDNGEDDTWYSRLPDEICFKHVAHLFSLAVQFTNHQAA
ncbi:E3 ubiquitin-protein ligase rnf213-alpha-like isoform X2 [Styela clava]